MKNYLSDEELQRTAEIYKETKSIRKTALKLEIARSTTHERIKIAAQRGMFGVSPVIPTYQITKVSTRADGTPISIQQKPEPGDKFELPEGHIIKGVSTLLDEDGRKKQEWVKTKLDYPVEQVIRTVVNELKKEIKPVKPVKIHKHNYSKLLNQYTITDHHFGMLAWSLETGNDSYDIKIAEKIILEWFSAAIALSPDSHTGIFAQLGDFMHHDSMEPVTPVHHNILDVDSRLQKIIRVVIRVTRKIISMLLSKHQKVHIIMASANHDPASSAWMRELLQALYDKEPRISIDTSPDIFYCYEWGSTALFYHHGHKRNINNVDSTLAGKFKALYGKSKYTYAHIGHMHSDGVVESNLMKIERHRTLAPPDAYSSGLGHISGRDAKVITYHNVFGEVSRLTISPEMIKNEKMFS